MKHLLANRRIHKTLEYAADHTANHSAAGIHERRRGAIKPPP
ncbi:MAG TPA: hypothetical protein VM008_00885 [Phycisphaerae bacterium]|nr:hypothetical protein [Phycisphaerae bacterium]